MLDALSASKPDSVHQTYSLAGYVAVIIIIIIIIWVVVTATNKATTSRKCEFYEICVN
jgi:hypothetical protein